MTAIADSQIFSTEIIEATLPEPLSTGWNQLDGVTVDHATVTIDPARYFFRYQMPIWRLCDWDGVRRDLLDAAETPEAALEQQVLDYIRTHGQPTSDPGQVLTAAWHVYTYLFRDEHLDDPELAHITPQHLRMLREMATMMALNRVELSGTITTVGPAWFFPVTAQVVYGLTQTEAETLDELYHGGFFNEYRRIESIKAHAALGGRLVHGCQSEPNMSGGCVVPYGTDIAHFRTELDGFKHQWMDRIRARRR